jgi:hypothetical protein
MPDSVELNLWPAKLAERPHGRRRSCGEAKPPAGGAGD